MKVIQVSNAMGGASRQTSFLALVRRIKLWLQQSSHPISTDDKPAFEYFGSYLLWELHKECSKSAHDYRGQRIVFEKIKELEEKLVIYRDDSPSQNYFFSKVKSFFASLEVIQSVLLSAPHVGFSSRWSLRDKIKSLNLPKNLFPQSLRPVESLAR